MPFKVKDWLVHPQHGVGRVVKLESRRFGGNGKRMYYVLAISTGTVWVPVDETGNGLRKVTDRADLSRYRKVLRGRPTPLSIETRQRKLDLEERMKKSSFQARCEVLRDLSAHAWRKPLNEGASTVFRLVRQMLCAEWAAAEGLTIDEAGREIDALLLEGKKTYGV